MRGCKVRFGNGFHGGGCEACLGLDFGLCVVVECVGLWIGS